MDDQAIKILSWISDVPHQLHHEHAKFDLVDGTGQWIFEDEVFLNWKDGLNSSILWLQGKPGSGKTKLMSLMIEDAHLTARQKCGRPPVYFYCSGDAAEPARRDARSILASIARQLSIYDHTTHWIHQSTMEIYVKRESRGFKSPQLDLNELKVLIVDLLERADNKPRTIFIDSLEECGSQASGALLVFFEHLLTISPSLVKLCISNSDYQQTNGLPKYPIVQITSKRNAKDIEEFVRTRSQELIVEGRLLLSGSQETELQEKIVSNFVANTDGIFCWANLQLLELCQKRTHAAILDRLSTRPQSLEELYREILQRIETYRDKTDGNIVQNAFNWLLYGYETLKSDVFLQAISSPVNCDRISISNRQLLDLCAGFVLYDVSLDIYRFSHPSVRHFLEKQPRYASSRANALITKTCLSYMLATNSEFAPWTRFIGYTCAFWAEHLRACAIHGDPQLEEIVGKFMPSQLNNDSTFMRWHRSILDGRLGGRFLSRPRLRARLASVGTSPPSILAFLCAFDLETILSSHPYSRLPYSEPEDLVLKAYEIAACCGSNAVIKWTLERKILRITDNLLKATSINVFNGDKTMLLFLKYLEKGSSICENVVEIVTENIDCGCQMMKILLQSPQLKVQLSQNSLLAICRSQNGRKLMEILLQHRGSDIKLTEEVLQEVVENEACGLQLMAFLLERRKADIIITENTLIYAVGNEFCGEGLIRLLSDEFGPDITITGEVLYTAAGNPTCGDELISLLLSMGPSDFSTEDLFQTAAENEGCGDRVMKVLLEKCHTELSITEDVAMSAAGNEECGEQIFSVLLGKPGPGIQITEDLLAIIIRNDISGERIMKLLLRGTESTISVSSKVMQIISEGFHHERCEIILLDDRIVLVNYPEILASVAEYFSKATLESVINKHGCGLSNEDVQQVLVAAARNRAHGDIILVYALERLAPGEEITENLLKAAAENVMLGDRIVLALHQRYGHNIKITEDILASAAGNFECGDLVMANILNMYPDQVNITDGVFEALAENVVCGVRILQIMLEKTACQVYLTRNAIEVIANCMNGTNSGLGIKTMQLLLSRSRVKSEAVDEILVATASHHKASPTALDLLLNHYGRNDSIGEEILEAAVRNIHKGYELAAYLLDRGTSVTEKVLCCAAENKGDSHEILKFLLSKLAPESRIPPTVLKAAASNTDSGACLVDLLLCHGAMEVDETVIHAAASNEGCGKSVLELLFRQSRSKIVITQNMLIAAASNEGCGKSVLELLFRQSRSKIVITQNMLIAAASGNLESLEFLLDQCQDGLCVTGSVLEAAAINISEGSHLFSNIISKCENEVRFTEAVLQACASNIDPGISTTRMKLILDGGGDALKITENTVLCVVRNWVSGYGLMKLLLQKRGNDVRITRKVMRNIATNPHGKKIIKLLLKDHTDGTISNISQEVILAAASNGRLEILKYLCQLAPLIPADPNWEPICRLYIAARDGYVDEVRRLVCNKCPADTKDSRGRSPLWIAAYYGHAKIVQILVCQEGVNVNSLSNSKRGPIFWPCSVGNVDVVMILLAAGAKTNIPDSKGDTPISAANENNQRVVVALLSGR